MIKELSSIREQLFDAPREVKESFNNIVQYFDKESEIYPKSKRPNQRGTQEVNLSKEDIDKFKNLKVWDVKTLGPLSKTGSGVSRLVVWNKDLLNYEEAKKLANDVWSIWRKHGLPAWKENDKNFWISQMIYLNQKASSENK